MNKPTEHVGTPGRIYLNKPDQELRADLTPAAFQKTITHLRQVGTCYGHWQWQPASGKGWRYDGPSP